MSAPPPELAWIGIIGGFVAILATIINVVIIWRNRRRIEFRTISANIYDQPWTAWDIEKGGNWPGPLGTKPGIPVGSCRRAFIVVEFAVKNEYPSEITVGRFMIDGWLFSDRYNTSGIMYAPKRDYRVFDLYTHAPTSLDTYAKIPPRGSYGLRVEVYEDTDGPQWKSNHSRYVVNLPRNYTIEFHTDVGRYRYKIRFPPPQHIPFEHVHHWSDELFPLSDFPALPQGLEYPKWQLPWRVRLQNWRKSKWNQMLYGKTYHLPGDPNRLTRALRKIIKGRQSSRRDSITTGNDDAAKG